MEVESYWELFLQTGAPEFYLLYREGAAADAVPRTA